MLCKKKKTAASKDCKWYGFVLYDAKQDMIFFRSGQAY